MMEEVKTFRENVTRYQSVKFLISDIRVFRKFEKKFLDRKFGWMYKRKGESLSMWSMIPLVISVHFDCLTLVATPFSPYSRHNTIFDIHLTNK